ncbi:PGF-pre-PGF domain-containing protein [Halogeometricum borinquense]|uniref:PGF-pre-PGF domain-containing protein n=1 Tax=Halogeometricum borinquense TaxID=60847 RepID=UPI00341C5D0F
MEGHPTRVVTVTVAALVILASLPAGIIGVASAETPTVPPESPGLNVTTETRTVGSASNVTVAYNLTGEIDAADVRLELWNGTTQYNQSAPGQTEGTLNLTVPASLPGGDHRVRVIAMNTSTLTSNASTAAVVETNSPVVIEDYNLSTTTPATGEEVTVNVTLNNTVGSQQNFSTRVYKSDSAVADANNTTVSLSANGQTHVELNVSYSSDSTNNLTVNDEPSTEVTVGDSGGSGSGGSTYTSVSAGNVTLSVGQSGTFDVTYDLGDEIDTADAKLEVSNFTTTLDTNTSLVDNDTVQMSLPKQSMAGDKRLQVAVRNTSSDFVVAQSVLNVSVRGNVTVESVTPPATAVASAAKNVSVTLNNTGSSSESFEISVFDDATNRFPVGSKFVSVPGNTKTTYNVSASYSEGTRTTYLGNESYGTTTVYPAATVESVTHVSGPANNTALSTSVDSGGMLTVELRNGTDQDLAPTGLTESSRFEVVVHLNHSVDPGLVIANARNVSWSVQNTSEHYVVTIAAQPLESQFMANAPSLDNWDSLSDSEDKADDKLLWYSVSFIDEDALYNQNMTNMTIATDAQTFGSPRYDEANDSINIELAAPHYTVSDTQNDGIYQATIPSTMLGQWGVSNPDNLTGTYQGQSRSITTTSNDDGSIDVSMNIHYSSGEVSLSPDASGDDTSSSGDDGDTSSDDSSTDDTSSSSDSDDDDDSSTDSTDDSTTDDTTTEVTPTDDAETNESGDASNETDLLPELTGEVKEVAAIQNTDGSSSAVVENVTANETVRIRLSNKSTDAQNATTNTSVGDDTGENATENESAGVTNASDRPAVNGLDLNLRNDTDSLGVNVSDSDTVPDGTPEFESQSDDAEAVGYLSIDVSGTTDDDIENATITFSVPAAKLAATNASSDDVTLHRYHDGEWQTLETTHLGGDRYAAETPGFSVFAVSMKKPLTADTDTKTTAAETTATEESTPQSSETETASASPTKTSTGAPGFGALVTFAALLAVAVLARRRA